MGMPQIPSGENRPTYEETVIDLLESIALEEMAIAHIMNAEGEKLQEIIKRFGCEEIYFCQLEEGCRSTSDMVNSLIMKEWLLLNKMNSILENFPISCDCNLNHPPSIQKQHSHRCHNDYI